MSCTIQKSIRGAVTIFVASICFALGCASNPDKLDAAYVSPLKYKDYDCDQLAMEMDYVGQRTNKLYRRLKKERKADNWQMGIGLALFWPTLFFLEGGDGPGATEYTQLKGEFEALRVNAVQKKCGIEALSPEELVKLEDAKGKNDPEKSHGEVEATGDESEEGP